MLDEVTLKKSIELAVTTERLGAGFYRSLAKKFSDTEELNELFSVLANDEATHEREFRSLLEKVSPDKESPSTDDRYQYLKAISISEFFKGEGEPLKDIDNIKNRDDALARAFALEKATLLYYHGMRDILGQNQVLQAIIDAEKSHLVSVMKYMLTGAKMRGLSDNW